MSLKYHFWLLLIFLSLYFFLSERDSDRRMSDITKMHSSGHHKHNHKFFVEIDSTGNRVDED